MVGGLVRRTEDLIATDPRLRRGSEAASVLRRCERGEPFEEIAEERGVLVADRRADLLDVHDSRLEKALRPLDAKALQVVAGRAAGRALEASGEIPRAHAELPSERGDVQLVGESLFEMLLGAPNHGIVMTASEWMECEAVLRGPRHFDQQRSPALDGGGSPLEALDHVEREVQRCMDAGSAVDAVGLRHHGLRPPKSGREPLAVERREPPVRSGLMAVENAGGCDEADPRANGCDFGSATSHPLDEVDDPPIPCERSIEVEPSRRNEEEVGRRDRFDRRIGLQRDRRIRPHGSATDRCRANAEAGFRWNAGELPPCNAGLPEHFEGSDRGRGVTTLEEQDHDVLHLDPRGELAESPPNKVIRAI